jgi:ABC-type nickel/cobalt efflux system permease component RcnA
MVSLTTGLLLGFLLGMRHALEPDHLAAVSVLVTRRGTATAGAVLGAIWGVGHTLALFAVGCSLAALGARIPPRLAASFELLVAAMLVTLGLRAILRDREGAHHRNDRPDAAPGRWRIARQPLLVGLVHGLAGSGALMTLVLARLPTATTRLCYIALFGIGSVTGMACLTGLAGWPLARIEAHGGISRGLSLATGAGSLLFGSFWGWSAVRALLDV